MYGYSETRSVRRAGDEVPGAVDTAGDATEAVESTGLPPHPVAATAESDAAPNQHRICMSSPE